MNDKHSKPAESKKSTKKPFEKLSGQEKQKTKDKRGENMDKKLKNNTKEKNNRLVRRTKTVAIALVSILAILVVTIPLWNPLREEIQTKFHFGDQPIMDKNLLGMELKYQVFSPRSPKFLRGNKPSGYLMANCFHMPADKTDDELITEVKERAKFYGWNFDNNINYDAIGREIYIRSKEKNGFILSVDISTPFEDRMKQLCITITDKEAW